MIDKDEIVQKSEEFEIHTSNVQRDYVFGWVLAGIYTASELKDRLILKGGNCLRKAYFENTRYSNDLDFSVQAELSTEFLKEELDKVCDFAQEMSGVTFEKEKNSIGEKKRVDKDKKAYEARLYFKDFYGNESKMTISIRLDISQFDKIYLPTQKRLIIHPYSDYQICNAEINCLKLEEVLASKLKCLLQRRHSADLFDYVFSFILNKDIEINRKEIISTLLKITIFERDPGFLKDLFIKLPFHVFKYLWKKHLICPKNSTIDFDNATEGFKVHILQLFEKLPIGSGRKAFFPAELRNLILEAGSNMTLMEIVYDGVRRTIEPYSLAYKKPSDSYAREYFYLYDRTGGRKSGPSIKSFLHPKITELKLTEEKFEPRYPIELSKMGEYGDKTYFGKPFSDRGSSLRSSIGGRRKTRRIKKAYSTFGPTYIYQCPICQKTFRRKKQSSQLNKHKDKYGNQCFGRTGYLTDIRY